MSRHKKRHGPAPVPPGNRPQGVPGNPADDSAATPRQKPADGASFQEQDPERRLGGFEGAGEHSRQQPSAANDGTTRSE